MLLHRMSFCFVSWNVEKVKSLISRRPVNVNCGFGFNKMVK